jgi:hypothetical protein
MLLVLIALLFLPAVSAFAQSAANVFRVQVASEMMAGPVVGATVYVWDKSNPGNNASALTDVSGSATIVLPGLTADPSSLTDPKPNIGVLVLPDNQANGTSLAFATTEMLFYNFWGGEAFAPEVSVMLPEGCNLTVAPKLKDGDTVTPGIVSSMQVFLPGVPWQVKTYILNYSDISISNPTWSVIWPKNSGFSANFGGDSAWSSYEEPKYYSWFSPSETIGDETTKTVTFVHERQVKAQFSVDSGTADTPFAIQWAHDADFSSFSQASFIGTGSVYLPEGGYNFRIVPGGSESLLPAIVIFPNVQLTKSAPVSRTISVTGGTGVSGTVALQNNPDLSIVSSNLRVIAQKKINFGGYESWLAVEEALINNDGTFAFPHKLVIGDEYRVITTYSYTYNYYNLGVVDYGSSPARSYAHVIGASFVVSSTAKVENLVLPQTAAAEISLNVTGATAANHGVAKDGLNLIKPEVALLPGPGFDYSRLIPSNQYELDTSSGKLFVPFLAAGNPFLVRVDYDEDYDDSTNPIVIKVSNPMTVAQGTTGVLTVDLDLTNFVTVEANLTFPNQDSNAPAGMMGFKGEAKAIFSPVISLNDGKELKAHEVFSKREGFDRKVFTQSDFSPFVFKAERGKKFFLNAVEVASSENGYYKPLQGFLDFNEIIAVPAGQSTAENMIQNIVVNEDRSFMAQVNVDGQPAISQPLTVKIETITDGNNFSTYILRQQNMTTDPNGMFRISGIPSGNYKVDLILDQLDLNNATEATYFSQSMPLLRREIFVAEDATSYPTTENPNGTKLVFGLNTSAIGFLDATVVDDKGQPVANAMVQVCRKPDPTTAMMPDHGEGSDYYMRGEAVFLCHTDAEGKVVRNAMGDQPTMIPLEANEYEVFVVGMPDSFKPADFSYDFAEWGEKPNTTVRIVSNGQITPARITLGRKFIVAGTIKESGSARAYLNFQILDLKGNNLGWGYTNQDGTFEITSGLLPGDAQFAINVEDNNGKRFYLHRVNVAADVTNNFVIDLSPTSLTQMTIFARDNDGAALPEAPGSLVLFSNPALGFRAPYWNINWMSADGSGRINISVPQIPTDQYAAGYRYGFKASSLYRSVEVKLPDGTTKYLQRIYAPPALAILDLAANPTVTLTWQKPADVTINVTNVPAAAEPRMIGVLMTSARFAQGPMTMEKHHQSMTGEKREMFFATMRNGSFVFGNVAPGQEYVFLAYEAFSFVDPYTLEWAMDMPVPAVFRHLSQPFFVDGTMVKAEAEGFRNLVPFTVTCTQDPTIVPDITGVDISFTADPVNTTGKIAWPIIGKSFWDPIPARPFPIMVPERYAFRVAFTPSSAAESKYLAKTYENVVVSPTNSAFNLVLAELPKVSGAFTLNNIPVNGTLVLVPEGADALSENFRPIRVTANNGAYEAYLKPGFYNGYAVPSAGAAKYIEITMASVSQTFDINIGPGVPVQGMVKLASGDPVAASVLVFRKVAARSSLTDGNKMYPYPAVAGDNEIRCGYDGSFFFVAEPNVDYYVQAVVPVGFFPGLPTKVSLGTTPTTAEVIVSTGGTISGSMNIPGWVEAKAVGSSALAGQFGTTGGFYADASIPNSQGRYDFVLYGLNPAMAYDLTFWPMEYGYSYKKISNVTVPSTSLAVDLTAGYRITGQLVNEQGQPLNAANVSVNLAMTLPSEVVPEPAAAGSSNLRMRRSITTVASPDYNLADAMLSGMWAQTNEYGQFSFDNVPTFLLAFIKVENGFAVDGINYGRTRTANFTPNFVNDLMHFEVKVPVGGRIIGRLIDEAGKPVTYSHVEANMGQEWGYTMAKEDGTFAIEGLAPGANYMVHLMEMPGFVPVFRSGVLVEPGKTTDLGSLVVAKAVMAYGMASGTMSLMKRPIFMYGMPQGTSLGLIAVDGNRALTDDDLLNGRFMQAVNGETDLYLDPGMEIDEVGFSMFVKPGKNSLGAMLHRETADGVRTYVSWGWKPGLVVPTQEQLEYGSFDISSGSPVLFPQKFGTVEGSLKHAVDTAVVFNPNDAVIALYPVVASGTTFVPVPTPFPTAMTSAVNGKWLIPEVPQGSYRIKVITRKYGTVFMTKVITVGDTVVVEDLALGTSIVKVSGKVVLDNSSSTPVSSAKVNLVLANLSTSTDASGNFAFYLPINELLIPQIEISKPGIMTKRFVEAGGIATSGARIATDTVLGNLAVSGSVGMVEVTVKSGKTNAVHVGAEVALVYQESLDRPVWTVGELQTTDENGKARFLSVPTGKEVTFRARAHYHVPTIATITVDPTTAAGALEITMAAAAPKVFYTGVVEPVDNDNLRLKASFDFNQVVVKNDIGLYIANPLTNLRGDASTGYPDLTGGRVTFMTYNGLVPNQDNLVATVTYTGFGDIGRFDIVSKAMFRKEYEVDPLAQNGFTGRQTDADGNVLPAGINVPPGYLPPEIDSFNLEVASPTIQDGDSLVDETGNPTGETPEFAGPTFKFTFGSGDSNFGAGTQQQGLFEITIAYDEGTKLEPRWYDVGAKAWSKVGIIQDSIRYDYPTKGYVTFKVDHLTEFAILKNVTSASSGYRSDFNGDGVINDKDLVILFAANQVKALADDGFATYDVESVRSAANELLLGAAGNTLYLPEAAIDDLDSNNVFNDSDVVLLFSYIQVAGLAADGFGVLDESTVTDGAREILGNKVGVLTRMPGVNVSR